jgi:hypothetical protein
MKIPYAWFALAICAVGSAVNAADLTSLGRGQLDRPIARLADQELGYSVLHNTGSSARGYRVHLTCTLDGSFLQTYCATKKYYASCPRAQIICQ